MINSIAEINKRFVEHGLSEGYWMETSVTGLDDNSLTRYIRQMNPRIKDCIEIGTYNGVGTIVLASASETVHTFDMVYRDAEYIWNTVYPELRKKIHYTVTPLQPAIDDQITRLQHFNGRFFDFNFAFVDGMHTYENVKHDFEMVKWCGRVLFHDVNMPEIKKFVEEIDADIYKSGMWMFALWEE